MLGTIVNTGTILVGSVAGSVLKKGIGEKYENAMFQACGLAAFGIGINAVIPGTLYRKPCIRKSDRSQIEPG